jgi:adenosylmethionine---8-amino-7-oxononanoate aminotransferase
MNFTEVTQTFQALFIIDKQNVYFIITHFTLSHSGREQGASDVDSDDKATSRKAARLEKLDKKYIWHPFTQMQDWEREEPVIIESGKGVFLTDVRGRRYLDGVSSLWVTVHGHRKKEIDRAVAGQLGRIAHSTMLGLSNVPAVLLAKQLVGIAPPGLSRVFYSDSGSTAVEIALKIAFQYWQQRGGAFRSKKKFISLTEAYHGDTIGSVSVGGIDLFHRIYRPLLFGTRKIESPHCYRCPYGKIPSRCDLSCLRHAEAVIRRHCRETAAVVIEPVVQGAAGMLVQPRGFLRKLRELCTRYGVLLIADEVATGFGRTGSMFACCQERVSPDILCVAKGITGGYLPLAATLTTEAIYRGFLGKHEDLRTFFHGHTYTGNPLACSAALASLDLFRKEKTLSRLRPKIRLLAQELERFKSLEHVGDVRQAGFMVGIELVRNRQTKESYPLELKMGIRVVLECRRHGVIIRPLGNVIVLMPPLSISEAQLKRLLKIVHQAIRTVTDQKLEKMIKRS